jgi:hypothetical protein
MNRDVVERSEHSAKKFILKKPAGSILEKTLYNIKIWVGPLLALKAKSFFNLKSYVVCGVSRKKSHIKNRKGAVKKNRK